MADALLRHKILLVEDSPSLATVYQEYLRAGPYDIRHAHCIADALKAFEEFSEVYQASTDQPLPLFRRRA